MRGMVNGEDEIIICYPPSTLLLPFSTFSFLPLFDFSSQFTDSTDRSLCTWDNEKNGYVETEEE